MYDGIVQELIDELGRLPGVGPKSAQRIAFHLIESDLESVTKLADVLREVKQKVRFCEICGNVSENQKCGICVDPKRDLSVICVVEESKDINAIERTREFRGSYHVLGGAISPIAGVGPDQLRIKDLMKRLADPQIKEVILATNPNLEGEATATYLTRLLGAMEISVTKLASGLPVGGDLEYADDMTLGPPQVGDPARQLVLEQCRRTSVLVTLDWSGAEHLAQEELPGTIILLGYRLLNNLGYRLLSFNFFFGDKLFGRSWFNHRSRDWSRCLLSYLGAVLDRHAQLLFDDSSQHFRCTLRGLEGIYITLRLEQKC